MMNPQASIDPRTPLVLGLAIDQTVSTETVIESLDLLLDLDTTSIEKIIEALKERFKALDEGKERALLFLLQRALDMQLPSLVIETIHDLHAKGAHFSAQGALYVDCAEIWALLLDKNWDAAGAIFQRYPLEFITQETTPLHFLYGCWLSVTEGREIAAIHFAGVLDIPFPRSWTLFNAYYLLSDAELNQKLAKNFMWERRQFYRQMALYSECNGEHAAAMHYQALSDKEYIEEV